MSEGIIVNSSLNNYNISIEFYPLKEIEGGKTMVNFKKTEHLVEETVKATSYNEAIDQVMAKHKRVIKINYQVKSMTVFEKI